MKREKIKKPSYKKWWVWLLAVVIIGAALGGGDDEQTVADGGNEVAQEAADAPENLPEEENEPSDEVVEVGIGVPAMIADVSFTVNSVEETKEISSGNEFIENATTEGKYVVLEITVKNDKKEALTINSSYFSLENSRWSCI